MISIKGWRLIPRVLYTNYHKQYPGSMSGRCFSRWFGVTRYWSGKLINFHVKHHQIQLDFRADVVGDWLGKKQP